MFQIFQPFAVFRPFSAPNQRMGLTQYNNAFQTADGQYFITNDGNYFVLGG